MRTKIEERTYFPWSVKEPLLKETNGKCAHCGIDLERYTNLTVEHIIPLNKGGTNESENLTVLCNVCNEAKSDMILPISWYSHLGSKKRKIVTERFTKYMTETDYLSEDCLMPMDTFRIEVPITTQKILPRGERIIRMPVFLQCTRMEREAAFEWLMNYRHSLNYNDRMATISRPSEWPAPCYLLKKGKIDVAMVNPWMIHKWDNTIKCYRNEILMDWFFSPDLPERDYLPEMLYYTVIGIEKYIADSISRTMTNSACIVLFRQRCFLSDKFCKPIFDCLATMRNDNIIEYYPNNSRKVSRLRNITAYQILGDKKSCKELKTKLDRKNPDGRASMEDAMKENEHFNKRFEKGE